MDNNEQSKNVNPPKRRTNPSQSQPTLQTPPPRTQAPSQGQTPRLQRLPLTNKPAVVQKTIPLPSNVHGAPAPAPNQAQRPAPRPVGRPPVHKAAVGSSPKPATTPSAKAPGEPRSMPVAKPMTLSHKQTTATSMPPQPRKQPTRQPAARAQVNAKTQGERLVNQPPRLRVIPLGGVDEIGKNMTLVEFGNDIIIVDCGSIFPSDDMLGVDLVIPDITYLQKNRDRIRGMLITHGHEDHIGSIPYVLKQLGGAPLPIYGTRLTLALITYKLKEHRMMAAADMRTIKAGEKAKVGLFDVEFVHVNHSITDSVALAITTPVGVIIFTGDFKIDYTPIDGDVTDLKKFAELGKRGVLALFMDSTNVERPGYTMSERTVGETFDGLFPQAQGRIIIAMFSSNVHRVQQVVDSAVKFGRMVCLTGRSMLNYSSVAAELGLLKIPEGRLIDIDDLERYADDELVIITTGSQGENMAGLSRMAFDEHRKLSIRKSDMVVLSASPIPGNEKSVSRVINQLFHKGANVIYEALADVHVSGHACQEELKLMHALISPKFFVPVHGEYRHLKRHSMLARSMGMPESHVVVASLGNIIEFTRNSIRVAGQIDAGQVLLDGSSMGDVGNVVLRDRKLLSQDGLLVLVMPIDPATGKLYGEIEMVSRGFVYMRESEELMEAVRTTIHATITANQVNKSVDINLIKNMVRDSVRDLLYKRTKRTPMILPVVVESNGGFEV